MTALSEALLAHQRAAINAATRAFVAGSLETESDLLDLLDNIGATDKVEQGYLLAALHVEQQFGASVPANGAAPPRPSTLDEPASQPQLDLIARLADERGQVAPQGPFTKAQASQVITALQRGEKVPF